MEIMLAISINLITSAESVFIDMIMTTRSSFFHVTVINFMAHEKEVGRVMTQSSLFFFSAQSLHS